MKFKRILVAIDESTFAAHAADVATDLAAQLGAELAFVTVVDTSVMPYTGDSGMPVDEWLTMMRREAKTLLNTFVSRRAVTPPPLQFLEEGKAATKVVDAARNWPADLIVMGTHGRNAVANALIGSVAQQVLQHAPCPVMVLRAQ